MKIERGYTSIDRIAGQYLENAKAGSIKNTSTMSFEEILKNQVVKAEELKFSKHADNRLNERNIKLTDEQLKRLEEGTEKARNKGIKESLVLVDEMAFIVSVKNNTVVTAMGKGEFDSVFTNIDGAVIV